MKKLIGIAATTALVFGGASAANATVTAWTPGLTASCDAVTFTHEQFRESTGPVYTLQIIGTGGVVEAEFVTAASYGWGETVTVATPDAEEDARYRVILRAANPALGGAYQQIGQADVWTKDCAPVVEIPEETPEPEDVPADEVPIEEDVIVPEVETHDVAAPVVPTDEVVAPVAPVAIETAA